MARATSADGGTAAARAAEGGAPALAVDSLADRVATALDADGGAVHRPELGSLVATVPADPQARNEARQAVAAVDDEAVRLKSAVKSRGRLLHHVLHQPVLAVHRPLVAPGAA